MLFNTPTLNQLISASPGITCTSTHFAERLWEPGDFLWGITRWSAHSVLQGVTATLGPPMNNWNTLDNRPTSMHITLKMVGYLNIYPVTQTVVLKDTDGLVLGTTNVIGVGENIPTIGAMDLDWTSSAAGAGVGVLEITPDTYSFTIYITCIELVGAKPVQDVTININSSARDLDLKVLFEATNPVALGGDLITFIVTDDSVIIDSSVATIPALDTGLWATGVTLDVTVASDNIRGSGGAGGSGSADGSDGGTAFLVQSPVNLTYTDGTISGGGGGGGVANGPIGEDQPNAGGGGGAGSVGGAAGMSFDGDTGNSVEATAGTTLGIGAGANIERFISGSEPAFNTAVGGSGGGLGSSGTTGSVGGVGAIISNGGAGGFSIDGYSLVTEIGVAGTLVGSTNG